MGAPGNVVSHDAVEADGGEQQSQRCEPGAELRDQLLLIHQMVHLLVDCLHFEHREVRIDLRQSPPDLFTDASGIAGRQNLQGVSIDVGAGDLHQGKIDRALRRLARAAVSRIPRDTYDLPRTRNPGVGNREAAPNSVAARKKVVGEGLIDDHHLRRSGRILLPNGTAEQHRYPHGFEVPGSDIVAQGIDGFVLFGCVPQKGDR